jgi:hypothetical protein
MGKTSWYSPSADAPIARERKIRYKKPMSRLMIPAAVRIAVPRTIGFRVLFAFIFLKPFYVPCYSSYAAESQDMMGGAFVEETIFYYEFEKKYHRLAVGVVDESLF